MPLYSAATNGDKYVHGTRFDDSGISLQRDTMNAEQNMDSITSRDRKMLYRCDAMNAGPSAS